MKKNVTIICLLCLFSQILIAQTTLQGDYKVGKTGDYLNLSEVETALNTSIITGDVTFLLEEGVYYENFILDSVKNNQFNITIGAIGDRSKTIVYPMSFDNTSSSGIYIGNTSNLTFRDLTIITDSLNQGMVSPVTIDTRAIYVENSPHTTFKNIKIHSNNTEIGVFTYYLGSNLHCKSCDFLTVDSSSFHGANQNISFEPKDTSSTIKIENSKFELALRSISALSSSIDGISIHNNVFIGDVPASGSHVFLVGNIESFPADDSYIGGIVINDNDFKDTVTSTNSKCIYLQYCQDGKIENNYILGGYYAIFLSDLTTVVVNGNDIISAGYRGIESAGMDTMIVTNNTFMSINAGPCLQNHTNYNAMIVANNTFYRHVKNGSGHYEVTLELFKGDSVLIVNNLFLGQDTVAAMKLGYFNVDLSSPSVKIDNNSYSNANSSSSIDEYIKLYKMKIDGNTIKDTAFSSLKDWQEFQPYCDQNSFSADTAYVKSIGNVDDHYLDFVAKTDLSITNGVAYRHGIQLESITSDIDKEVRTKYAGYDIGADQYYLFANPTFSSCNKTTEITIINSHENIDSYTWYLGDGNTSTEKEPIHSYVVDGQYFLSLVTCESSGYCDSMNFKINTINPECITVGNNSNEKKNVEFNIFPNPAKNKITLVSSEISGDVNVTLSNISGVSFYEEKGDLNQISQGISQKIISLNEGVYILRIIYDKGILSRKIIIRK